MNRVLTISPRALLDRASRHIDEAQLRLPVGRILGPGDAAAIRQHLDAAASKLAAVSELIGPKRK